MELARRHLEYLLLRNRIIHPNGCWTNNRNNLNEYSHVYLANGEYHLLHRISAYLYLGLDIENKDLQANHKINCPYKGCWNPDHLYIGTQSENMYDQVKFGNHKNASKTHCKRGHKFDQIRYNKKGKVIARRCSQCRRIYG